MRLVVHNHLAGASATNRDNFSRTLRFRKNLGPNRTSLVKDAVSAEQLGRLRKMSDDKLSVLVGMGESFGKEENKEFVAAARAELTRRGKKLSGDRKTHDCKGDENCSCGCHSHDAQPADYFARVKEHLKTLSSPAAKKKFLQEQHDAFEQKYLDFQERVRKDESLGPNETAWNYSETLTELHRMLSAVG